MASIKIIGTVDTANSTSNTTNQANTVGSRLVTLVNYGATPAQIVIVPTTGPNTNFIVLGNSMLSVTKANGDVITSNSATLAVSKSVITG